MRPEDIQYDKLDQIWAQYDKYAQSVCQCHPQLLINYLKQFISFLEQHELFVDFNHRCLPQVDLEHWLQETRLHTGSFIGGNGSLFPSDQKERLALQLNTLRAIVQETIPLQSFCTELLCQDQTDVNEEVFIKKIFQPFVVEYKWEVKQRTSKLIQDDSSQDLHQNSNTAMKRPVLEPLQNLAFIITGYPEDDDIRDALIRIIRRSCYRTNIRVICQEDIETTHEVTEQTFKFLQSACMVICDVTQDHPNLHKVLDYARDLNQFMFLLTRNGKAIPMTNNGAIVIRYCNLADLESQLTRKLRDFRKENS